MNAAVAKRQTEINRERLEQIRNTEPQTVETCSSNDCWRQGDVELRFIDSERPEDVPLKEIPVPTQLAPGTTQGSRHTLQPDPEIRAFLLTDATPLEGPVLFCPNGITVPHPQHGDVTFKEPGWYAVIYERVRADEIARQED